MRWIGTTCYSLKMSQGSLRMLDLFHAQNQELAQCASGGPMQLQLAEEASRQGGLNGEGLL